MKNITKFLILVATLVSNSSFADEAELLNLLYGSKPENPPSMGIPAKTQATIVEMKGLKSGDRALYLEMKGQPLNEERLWVNYSSKNPSVRPLQGGIGAGLPVEVSQNITGYTDPGVVAVKRIDAAQESVKTMQPCETCDAKLLFTAGPVADENPGKVGSPIYCRGLNNVPVVDLCRVSGLASGDKESAVEEFKIQPEGQDPEQKRLYRFHFRGLARQDMGLSIEEGKFGSEIIIFPRKDVPKVRVEGDDVVVTLPNGEEVRYDKVTAKLKGGVLAEAGSKASPAKLAYSGSGVMVQVSGQNKGAATFMASAKQAVISKKGQKDCVVSPSELWPNRKDDDGNNHFRFATDDGFDQWLKAKCGFGL